ncbi:MAG: hypothetical protein EA383_12185 [Spirochaetaceae bacterium]|nr:MAG: hypothetical protein EA383_12185 [Spirochaetaceae bacterium]
MKMSPEFIRAQRNMQPGEITADGFLGDDSRSLIDIIAADEAAMSDLDLAFDDCASQLEDLMEAGRRGLGEPVTIDATWRVKTDEARGVLPSPFEDGVFRKVNATIELVGDASATLRITALSLHLMKRYHFLQGLGAAFRIEPRMLKRVLKR